MSSSSKAEAAKDWAKGKKPGMMKLAAKAKASASAAASAAAAKAEEKAPDMMAKTKKMMPIAKKVAASLVPVNLIAFLKNPTTSAIEADPTILLSMLNVLSLMKNPAYGLLTAALTTGAKELMKTPEALAHIEGAKVAALGHAVTEATMIDVPPEILREVVKHVSVSDMVSIVKSSGVGPGDAMQLAKMAGRV